MRALRAGLALVAVMMMASCAQHPEFAGAPPAESDVSDAAQVAPTPSGGVAVYTLPTRGPAAAPALSFTASRSQVVRSIRSQARARGLEVTQRDNALGLVVARYQGPATDHLDCGVYSIPGSPFGASAIAGGVTRATDAIAGATRVRQDTHLNARLVAQVERQSDDGATAQVLGHYVLRRDLVFSDDAGNEIERRREFIDLTTDQEGRFSDDVVCVATGSLERSVLPEGGVAIGS